jgi:hypothetical protein
MEKPLKIPAGQSKSLGGTALLIPVPAAIRRL